MARYDDLNTSVIGYATILSALLLVVIIVGVEALCYHWENVEEKNKEKYEYVTSTQVLDQQKKSLSQYEWVKVPAPEPEKGKEKEPDGKRLQIPLERAQEIILSELGKGKKSGDAEVKPGA